MSGLYTPCITTIIPTYRRPELLRRAIRSVLGQTYKNIRVCVYDNASGDETASVVEELARADTRIQYHCHAENLGAYENFSYGATRVETPFFSILSDDDILLPGFYETALEGFDRYPEAWFSVTDVIHAWKDGFIRKTDLESWEPGVYRPPAGLEAMLAHGHPTWTGFLIRREVLKGIGFIVKDAGASADLDFTLRMAARYPFVVSKRPGAIYDVSQFEVRTPYAFDMFWPGLLRIIQHLSEVESLPEDAREFGGRALLAQFDRSLFPRAVYYLSREMPGESEHVLSVIQNHFGGTIRAAALSGLIRGWRRFSVVRLCFGAGIRCFRRLQYARVRRRQKRYAAYRRLMDMFTADVS